jgi:hypothetical protein
MIRAECFKRFRLNKLIFCTILQRIWFILSLPPVVSFHPSAIVALSRQPTPLTMIEANSLSNNVRGDPDALGQKRRKGSWCGRRRAYEEKTRPYIGPVWEENNGGAPLGRYKSSKGPSTWKEGCWLYFKVHLIIYEVVKSRNNIIIFTN